MFQKDHSSSAGSGGGDGGKKKARDAAVRKSDRKRLLRAARDSLLFVPASGGGTDADSSTTPLQQQQQQQQQRLEQILEDAFLKGSLVQRSLKLPHTKSVYLYFRSPSSTLDAAAADADNSSTARCSWPYHQTPQCVWLQVEPAAGAAGGATACCWQVPGLALLAVLCHSGITATATTTALPVVEIPSQASKFVCRGANVMRAGILKIIRSNNNDNDSNNNSQPPAVAAVTVRGNPQPFAVGVLHSDLLNNNNNNSAKLIGPGTRGTGVTVVHCYGDDLWKQQSQSPQSAQPSPPPSNTTTTTVNRAGGAPFDNGHYGNAGFVEGRCVVPIGAALADDADDDESAESGGGGEEEDVADAPPAIDAAAAAAAESGDNNSDAGKPSVTADIADAAAVSSDEASDHQGSGATGEDNPDENGGDSTDAAAAAEGSGALTPEDVLHHAVCRALVSLNSKRDLPMTVANFYAQHVLPHRPPGTTVQLKRTRYKKFGAYVAEQVQSGLLTVGPDPHNKQKDPLAVLEGFDRRHQDLRPFLEEQRSSAAGETFTTPSSDSGSNKRLVLADLYCVPNHFVSLLRLDRDTVKAVHATSEERRGTGMLTLKEARQVLEDYIAREGLSADNNSGSVQLDGPLTDVFYKKNKKKNKSSEAAATATPTSLSRKDAVAQWQACLEPAYALVRVPGSAVVKLGRGKPPQVTIEVTRRQSKKYLTAVRGLEAFGVDAAAFARDATHRFACSSSVQPAAGGSSNTNNEAHFQGNLADELEALLVGDESLSSHGGVKGSTYHLPKNAIDVVLRKGVPARKKRGGGGKSKK